MTYTFQHIETKNIDPLISGNDQTIEVTFKCEGFLYYAMCYQKILQFVRGEKMASYLNWPVPPTSAEIQAHDLRREEFNGDHSILQSWLDTL